MTPTLHNLVDLIGAACFLLVAAICVFRGHASRRDHKLLLVAYEREMRAHDTTIAKELACRAALRKRSQPQTMPGPREDAS